MFFLLEIGELQAMNNSVIYFLQRDCDGLIKIGTTINLWERISTLRQKHGPLNLLGIIDGGKVREKILHWCFQADRIEHEFFTPTDELREMIEKYAHYPKSSKKQPTLKEVGNYPQTILSGTATATAAELARLFGVARNTIVNWSNSPLVKSEMRMDGRRKYYVFDVESIVLYLEYKLSLLKKEAAKTEARIAWLYEFIDEQEQ